MAHDKIIFGVRHSDFLEVGTKIDRHNHGLLGEGKIERFYLDVGRIIGSSFANNDGLYISSQQTINNLRRDTDLLLLLVILVKLAVCHAIKSEVAFC